MRRPAGQQHSTEKETDMKRTNLRSTTFTLLAAVAAVIFTAHESRAQAQTAERAQICRTTYEQMRQHAESRPDIATVFGKVFLSRGCGQVFPTVVEPVKNFIAAVEQQQTVPASAAGPMARNGRPSQQAQAPAQARAATKGTGPLTEEDVKATLEESLTAAYQNHFYGVKNKVTFEWIGPIKIGAAELRPQARGACYPVKLRVKVTATDPRDGNRSTVERGVQASIGPYTKKEIFCFFRDGFGEWTYGTYEP
jgi:hypothetical protein